MLLHAALDSFRNAGLLHGTKVVDVSDCASLHHSKKITHSSALDILANHVCRLLLIDEHDDRRRITIVRENFNHTLPIGRKMNQ